MYFSSLAYWKRPHTAWGSVADWDLFYINEMPSTTRAEAHKTLARELKVLLECLEKDSREWNKANAIKNLLKVSFSKPFNKKKTLGMTTHATPPTSVGYPSYSRMWKKSFAV